MCINFTQRIATPTNARKPLDSLDQQKETEPPVSPIAGTRHTKMTKKLTPSQIFETVIYSIDLADSKKFYAEVLNLSLLQEYDGFLVFQLPQSVLLIFNSEQSSMEGREVPQHGTVGAGHVAFGAAQADIELWIEHFENAGIEIERIVEWPEGGRSLYVRDPSGNSVEFAPPTLWGGSWEFSANEFEQ